MNDQKHGQGTYDFIHAHTKVTAGLHEADGSKTSGHYNPGRRFLETWIRVTIIAKRD